VNLRHKFGIVALVYVLSLSANLVMSGWCIVVYFQSAFVEFQSSFVRQAQIEQVRAEVRRTRSLPPPRRAEAVRDLATSIRRLEPSESGTTPDVQQAAVEELAHSALTAGTAADWDRLDHQLGMLSSAITQSRQGAIERAGRTQQKVVYILVANAACGAVLCVVGLILVRRWILSPVAQLREAARQISEGNFAYRIEPRAPDELGHLAEEVNQMAATITEMQNKLVAQERLAAAGEMVTRLAHNIRNPLAGIRALAEATMHQADLDADARENQTRIMESIDRFEKWLRDLQQSVSPLKLNVQPMRIDPVVENVRQALVPLADKRGVRLETRVAPDDLCVRVDGFHFEQALVALVTNALQASGAGMAVRLTVDTYAQASGWWRVRVRDEGEGIDEKVHRRIFEPYFTTKPGGNGVGLSIAHKVVQVHGGRLDVQSSPGSGCTFVALMPGRVSDSN